MGVSLGIWVVSQLVVPAVVVTQVLSWAVGAQLAVIHAASQLESVMVMRPVAMQVAAQVKKRIEGEARGTAGLEEGSRGGTYEGGRGGAIGESGRPRESRPGSRDRKARHREGGRTPLSGKDRALLLPGGRTPGPEL